MELLNTTRAELNRVDEARKAVFRDEMASIDALLAEIAETKRIISQDEQAAGNALSTLLKRTQDAHRQLNEQHKSLQATINKYGKLLEKKYGLDLDAIGDATALQGTEHSILEAIHLHFLVEGQLELAHQLAKESKIITETSLHEKYVKLFEILEPLKKHNLTPALEWIEQNEHVLQKEIRQKLEFSLRKLHYLSMLVEGDVQTAILYARSHFAPFSRDYLKEIQRMMCATLYVGQLDTSPYAYLFDESQWTEVERLFREEYCTALGIPSKSPLYISAAIGTTAIPSVIKMSQVVRTNRTEWTQQDELPVSIPIPDQARFHSTFVCPVSKDYATPENPPMRLPCGHVISQESLMKLSNSNNHVRFKCPYCPSESTGSQAMQVYF